MRVAVFGAGGVGAYFGARLAASGEEVAVIARGPHLEAIRAHGLRVESVLGDVVLRPYAASESSADIGPVDVVLLGVKTWQLPEAVSSLRALLGPRSFIVPLQNGVEAPEVLAVAVGREHVVGGVCSGFCFIAGPGHVRHIGGATFLKFGELDGSRSARVETLHAAFVRANVDASVPEDVQAAAWEKFMLVVPFGGIGALARAPIGVLMQETGTRELMIRGMREIEAVGRALGVALAPDAVERTVALLDGVTPAGTSSLQRDVSAGKRSELDSWTGAVVRLGRRAGVPTPLHDVLYAALLPQERRARGELAF